MTAPDRPDRPGERWQLGVGATLALGLLAVPRVVLHDLGVDVGPLNLLLVLGPPVAWVWYVVRRRVDRPLLAVTIVGVVYGVVLAAAHMVLWDEAFEDGPPRLGGELAGELSAGTEEVVLRVASSLSSIAVGAVVGAVAGLVAEVLARRVRSAASR
ncbi:MAG TPA: hypothetical protein VFU19_18750 [Iamia sp.]|nr:hypothetical protein [Iamia sp.]